MQRKIKITENIMDNLAWRERAIGFKHDFISAISYHLINKEKVKKENAFIDACFLFKEYEKKGIVGIWQHAISDKQMQRAILFLLNNGFIEKENSEIQDLQKELFK
jgi:hypothetical protein